LALAVPGVDSVSVLRLIAPRPDDTTDVTFGGAVVGNDGAWMPTIAERLAVRRGTVMVSMPRASGALVTLAA
jgi:hypothetical protein